MPGVMRDRQSPSRSAEWFLQERNSPYRSAVFMSVCLKRPSRLVCHSAPSHSLVSSYVQLYLANFGQAPEGPEVS